MRQKPIPNSCKDKHRFKAVCVAGNSQHFYKVELNLSNRKMKTTSLTCEHFIWSDYQALHKGYVAKGKKEASSSKQQSQAVRIRPHYFAAIFCLVHYT